MYVDENWRLDDRPNNKSYTYLPSTKRSIFTRYVAWNAVGICRYRIVAKLTDHVIQKIIKVDIISDL